MTSSMTEYSPYPQNAADPLMLGTPLLRALLALLNPVS